jgi:hypothetical protein
MFVQGYHYFLNLYRPPPSLMRPDTLTIYPLMRNHDGLQPVIRLMPELARCIALTTTHETMRETFKSRWYLFHRQFSRPMPPPTSYPQKTTTQQKA